MNRIVRLTLFLVVMLPTVTTSFAEIITIDGTVTSVDVKKRTITVEIEDKSRTLDVGSKAKIIVDGKDVSLELLTDGQSVSIGYHDQLEVVVKIVVRSAVPEVEQSTILFDGKTLNGWKTLDSDRVYGWEALDGELVALPLRDVPLLVTEEKFDDFELECEFQLEKKGNSGIYLRGRYEVQLIDNDSFPKVGPKNKCGSIFGQLAPAQSTYRGPGQWNTLFVRLKRKTVTVIMNGTPLIEDRYINEVTAEAVNDLEDQPGPIALQNRGGLARFRNISIRRTSEDVHETWLIGSFDIDWTEKPGGNTGSLVYRFSPKHEVFRGDKLIGKWEQEGDQFRVEFADSDRGYVLITPEGTGELRAIHFWSDGRQATWTGKRQKHKR